MTAKEKRENFTSELKTILKKYGAEICIEDFGVNYSSDYRIVVDFDYSEPDGFTPQIQIGHSINGD